MGRRYGLACPVAKALDILGEKWTLLLVRDLLVCGPRRFRDFQESLEGITPSALSTRLKTLEEAGLVSRQFYSDHPPRAEYVLTSKGRELGPIVGGLRDWGDRNL